MAITFPSVFQSAIADNAADLAAGFLTPSRYNTGCGIAGLTTGRIPYPSSATALTDSANLTFDGNNLSVGTAVKVGDGTNAAPTLRFSSEATGFYLVAASTPGISIAGTNYFYWTTTGFKAAANGAYDIGGAAAAFRRLYLDYTNTATVGDVTINKASGRVNLGAGGTTLILTNSLITAASHIFLNSDGAPGNVVAVQFYAVAAGGSCTINAVPAVTNQTAIDFVVVNAD